jgi:hypothetical protein
LRKKQKVNSANSTGMPHPFCQIVTEFLYLLGMPKKSRLCACFDFVRFAGSGRKRPFWNQFDAYEN